MTPPGEPSRGDPWSPREGAARKLLGELLGAVTGAQQDGCLPALPPEGEVTPCVDALADLLAQIHAALAALISIGPPDIPAALEQVTLLQETAETGPATPATR